MAASKAIELATIIGVAKEDWEEVDIASPPRNKGSTTRPDTMKHIQDKMGFLESRFSMSVPLFKNELQPTMNKHATQYDRVCKGEFGELHTKQVG